MLSNQAAVANIASALFEDEPPCDTVPGYAVLHVGRCPSAVSIVRHNRRLYEILHQLPAPSDAMVEVANNDDAVASRLLDDLWLQHGVGQEHSYPESSMRTLLSSEYDQWRQSCRLDEDPRPCLWKQVFGLKQASSTLQTRSNLKS